LSKFILKVESILPKLKKSKPRLG